MRYFGSKFSTLECLGEIIGRRMPQGTFCDAFGGIGTVGAYFKGLGYKVSTGDMLLFAHCFQIARIRRQRSPSFRRVKKELGLPEGIDITSELNKGRCYSGWFVQEYSKKRKFFTVENARKIERAWRKIINWKKAGWLNPEELAVLNASLIQSMDRVANTAGTYYAYLKSFHRKAQKDFHVELLRPAPGPLAGECFLGPAQSLIESQCFDVLYLDPPYNSRSYAHYYHLPQTIARGEKVDVHGLSGIPTDMCERSIFNDPKMAASALKALVSGARFRYLAFHYADDGIISPLQIRRTLSEHGKLEEIVLNSRGYTTKNRSRHVPHRLYLLTHA